MRIELTESEYNFLYNLLNTRLIGIKNDISDIESDILNIRIDAHKSKIKDLRFQKQEFIARRNKLKGLIEKISKQKKQQIT